MRAPWTVGAVLEAAHKFLSEKKLPSARLEAELLLAHALDLTRLELYTQFDRPVDETERQTFRNLIKERSTGRPLQHLTGVQSFRRLRLKMADGVFIPRPETELLVERVLACVAAIDGPVPVLDLGAGSGAICVSVAVEAPDADVWAVDVSDRALALARANAIAHEAAERITFCHGDLFAALPPEARFKVIVANPPYIPSGEIESLSTEVRDHEPRAALDGGPRGLDIYHRIIAGASDYLEPGGVILFEIGEGQAPAVVEMLESGGFYRTEVHKDYAGIERIVTGSLVETPRWTNKVSRFESGPVAEAARILKTGGLVVVPTDTVYGLACLLDDEAAIERIFEIKGRPAGKGLIAMIADDDDLAALCASVPSAASALAARFWPGPLTIVLEGRENLSTKAVVRGKIGVRLPDHGMLRDLIRAVGSPLAVTSANFSGRPSSVDAAGCRDDLGEKVDLIIDGGPSPLGIESTVIDVAARPPEVIREGAIPAASLMEVIRQDGR